MLPVNVILIHLKQIFKLIYKQGYLIDEFLRKEMMITYRISIINI